jgi:formylmethanofuran dehydrogenase subunit E
MSNDDRAEAQRLHDQMARDIETAKLMPRLVSGPKTRCASCDEYETAIYKVLTDGAAVPVCGPCYERLLDDVQQQRDG